MMELVTRRMHMHRQRGSVTSQMTLDDDFNVPDSMDDVEQLIFESGEIVPETIRNLGERVQVKGRLVFRVLYRTPDGQVMTLAGNLPFDEHVNVAGLDESDVIQMTWELDDLNVGLINSRKLSVRALITLHIMAETIEDVAFAEDVRSDGTIEALKRNLETTFLKIRKKDTFRIRQMITVPGNRPDIEHLLWQDVKLRGIRTKLLDGKLQIEGAFMVFLIYTGLDSQMPIQCMEETVSFSGSVDIAQANEDMIPLIQVKLAHKELEVNPDSDGEMREISLDAVLELEMRLYAEEKLTLLEDLYALDREVIPQKASICLEQILMKNAVKHKIQERIDLSGGRRALQICHSDGTIKIDEIRKVEEGICIEGVVEVKLLYLTAEDSAPISVSSSLIPFQILVEVPGMQEDSMYHVNPSLEQISAVMTGGDQVEVKALVAADVLVLGKFCESVTADVREEPLDAEKLKRMPGIVGYVVQQGDSLWKIAREYHTSVDAIKAANHLNSSEIRPGDKLILVKMVRT